MGSPLPVDSKHTLMQWKSSSACAKIQVMLSAETVILTVLWDSQEVLLNNFQRESNNVNSECSEMFVTSVRQNCVV